MKQLARQNVITSVSLALLTAWYAIIWIDARTERHEWAMFALPLVLVLSWLGLRQVAKLSLDLPASIRWLAAPVFAWLIFVAWGTLLGFVNLARLVPAPSTAALVLLFLSAPLAAIIAGCLFAYPLAVLYRRDAWWVTAVLCVPTLAMQFPGILQDGLRQVTFVLLAIELATLPLVLIGLAYLLGKRQRAVHHQSWRTGPA